VLEANIVSSTGGQFLRVEDGKVVDLLFSFGRFLTPVFVYERTGCWLHAPLDSANSGWRMEKIVGKPDPLAKRRGKMQH
jgi:hypothetical protein